MWDGRNMLQTLKMLSEGAQGPNISPAGEPRAGRRCSCSPIPPQGEPFFPTPFPIRKGTERELPDGETQGKHRV